MASSSAAPSLRRGCRIARTTGATCPMSGLKNIRQLRAGTGWSMWNWYDKSTTLRTHLLTLLSRSTATTSGRRMHQAPFLMRPIHGIATMKLYSTTEFHIRTVRLQTLAGMSTPRPRIHSHQVASTEPVNFLKSLAPVSMILVSTVKTCTESTMTCSSSYLVRLMPPKSRIGSRTMSSPPKSRAKL